LPSKKFDFKFGLAKENLQELFEGFCSNESSLNLKVIVSFRASLQIL